MKSMRARVVLLALAVTLLAGVASAQNAGDTERKLRELRKELKQIGSERRKLEGQRGEANRAVTELLAKALGVPKRAVRLLSGATSRLKQVAVDGDPEQLGAALRKLTATPSTD